MLARRGATAYVFWTRLDPQVIDAAPPWAMWVNVGESPTSYWEALCAIWAQGEDFITLEHDVICRPDVVEQFDTCPEQWCRFSYVPCHPECLRLQGNYLGCTRFRSEMIQAVPLAVGSIADRAWSVMCEGLGANLRAEGFTPHSHSPHVRHLKD